MNNKFFKNITPLLNEEYGAENGEKILNTAKSEFQNLCNENSDESKAVKKHTVEKIYPNISLYRALQNTGIEKEKALKFLDISNSRLAEPQAESMRMLCKIPFIRKKMPVIFKWVTLNSFGEAAGFKAKFYDMGKNRVKFDMEKCLYCDVCRKNGCPELTVCFCHTDDVTDGNMHPDIIWNRTKIMGDGADVCDFDLIVKENKRS